MAKAPFTYIDEITDLTKQICTQLAESKIITGLLLNKPFNEVTDDDIDTSYDNYILPYSYVPDTVTSVAAYIFVEVAIAERAAKENIKMARIYITVACHKDYMDLSKKVFDSTIVGTRRDNLARFSDKVLRDHDFEQVGKFRFLSTNILSSTDNFVFRRQTYDVGGFHMNRDFRDIPGLT